MEFGLFIQKIETTFAHSEEKKSLAYEALVRTCELKEVLYCSVGDSDYFLTQFLFEKTEGIELLAIEIVKVLMLRGNKIESYFRLSEIIHDFCIKKDEKFLIEIAKHEAVRSPGHFSDYIHRYGIKNQDALLEIAKLSAIHCPHMTIYNMKKFGINDERDVSR